jgi:hypothetical protein
MSIQYKGKKKAQQKRENENRKITIKKKDIMKKTLITLYVALVSFTTALADNDRAIQFNQLPQAAQTFLNSHFKNAKIAMVTTERDWLSQEYNVVFVNGDKIEFDSKGNWENIECKRTFIPQGAIPAAITKYLNENFPGTKVTEIDLDNRGYDVDLSNGMEIKFDKNFLVYKIKK